MTTKEKVQKEARYLDRSLPGWENDIDIRLLNLEDNDLCVYGQLLDRSKRFSPEVMYGTLNWFVNWLKMGVRLFVSHDILFSNASRGYWIAEINKRKPVVEEKLYVPEEWSAEHKAMEYLVEV